MRDSGQISRELMRDSGQISRELMRGKLTASTDFST